MPRDHLREVRSCIATLRFGVERLREEPLSLDFVRALHERLLRGEVGAARTPGEFRTSQNWIGPPGATLATATYVPHADRPSCTRRSPQWEAFLQERGTLPDLVQCAMLHAQFESIHPFVGGNGRLGRLLITLFLIERGASPRPLLYLSAFLEGHRDEYYALLQRVRTHGEWVPWLTLLRHGRPRDGRARDAAGAGAHPATTPATARRSRGTRSRSPTSCSARPASPFPRRSACWASPTRPRAARSASSRPRGCSMEWGEKHWPRVYLARHVLDAVLHPLEDLRSLPGPRPGRRAQVGAARAQAPLGAPTA